jgi:hypothetical protein
MFEQLVSLLICYSSRLLYIHALQYEYDLVGGGQKRVLKMLCRSRGGRNNVNSRNADNFGQE